MVGSCGGTTGQYPSPTPTTDSKFTLSNSDSLVFDVNICNGDTQIGNTVGTVFALSEYWGSSAVAHTTSSVVQSYRFDKFTLQNGGPITTVAVGYTSADNNIPISGNHEAFSVGDLVLVYDAANEMEIIQVTSAPVQVGANWTLPTASNATYTSGGRGVEGTTAITNTPAGRQVVKLRKYENDTVLADPLGATRTAIESPNTDPKRVRVKLFNSDLIADKLDTAHFFKVTTGTDVEWFWASSKDGTVSSDGITYAKSVPSGGVHPITGALLRDKFFGGGKLTVHDDFELYSGNFRMYGSDGQTLLFGVSNDDNHPGDPATIDPKTGQNGIFFNGRARFKGDLELVEDSCEANGVCSTDIKFFVDSATGDTELGTKLYVKGHVAYAGDSSRKVFHIDNLGGAEGAATGPNDFIIYHDNSIDAFGISRYWTRNGGRRYTYVEQSLTGIGQTQAAPLQANNNYLLNNPSGTNMVLYLPDDAETGDMIRFVEVAGTSTYNTTIVIRALKVGSLATAIQGDTSGSKIQAGTGQLSSAWDSGEMIVQTRNASFGLIFVGSTDAAGDPNASSIPSNLRGWWLAEL